MLPSHMQLSQRVIDYRQNVERGLIDFNNGFIDDKALREVLHYGWENKTKTFLATFDYLQTREQNFFLTFQPKLNVSFEDTQLCNDSLLVARKMSGPVSLSGNALNKKDTTTEKRGGRFYIHYKEKPWFYAYLMDKHFTTIGSGKKLENSFLPRNLLRWIWQPFNGYASTSSPSAAAYLLLTDKNNKAICYQKASNR